ncbi:MAG: hypothetical protein A2Y60_04105 [Chloroflexi bacterium RBG_13_54_9]|nr:MAG: hypothetical protein A2Y60_04105 [Chloroflexi bacterium RBG_13_54_9]
MASVFGIAFFIEGLAVSGYQIGWTTYLYDIAPERDRLTYFGLANTILAPFQFLPAVGGALLGVVGFAGIYAVAAAMLTLAFGLTTQLQSEKLVRAASRQRASE